MPGINPFSISRALDQVLGPIEAEETPAPVAKPVAKPARKPSAAYAAWLAACARRREDIYARRRRGDTFAAIAKAHGVTRNRAFQLYQKHERQLCKQPLTADMIAVLQSLVQQLS